MKSMLIQMFIVAGFFMFCAACTFRLFHRVIGTASMMPYLAFGVAFGYVLWRRLWVISMWPEKSWESGIFNNVVSPVVIGSLFLLGVEWFDHLARKAHKTAGEMSLAIKEDAGTDCVDESHEADNEALIQKLKDISSAIGAYGRADGEEKRET